MNDSVSISETQKKHLIIIHSGEYPYVCSECDYKCVEKRRIVSHMKRHVVQTSVCPKCDRTFAKVAFLKHHLKSHLRTPRSCRVCQYQCASKAQLEIHMIKHTDARDYMCDQCGEQFKHLSSLRDHLFIHSGKKLLACCECNFQCAREWQFDNHMRWHAAEKPYSCERCEKKFRFRNDLKLHLRNSFRRETICMRSVWVIVVREREASSLTWERTPTTDRMFASIAPRDLNSAPVWEDIPDCTLKRNHTLAASVIIAVYKNKISENHAKLHTGEKPFRCGECNKTFKSSLYFEKHLKRVHSELNVNKVENDGVGEPTGEKPYKCSVCDKRFGLISSLEVHSRTHGREKSFPCTVCDYRCAHRVAWERHMRTHTARKTIPMQHVWLSKYTEQSPHSTYDDSHGREGIHVRQVQQTVQTQLHPVEAFENPRWCEAVRVHCVWLPKLTEMELGQSHSKVDTRVRNHTVVMNVVKSSRGTLNWKRISGYIPCCRTFRSMFGGWHHFCLHCIWMIWLLIILSFVHDYLNCRLLRINCHKITIFIFIHGLVLHSSRFVVKPEGVSNVFFD